jgi:hypothetical protein
MNSIDLLWSASAESIIGYVRVDKRWQGGTLTTLAGWLLVNSK